MARRRQQDADADDRCRDVYDDVRSQVEVHGWSHDTTVNAGGSQYGVGAMRTGDAKKRRMRTIALRGRTLVAGR